jgi:2-polyprenyl-3-methyl-5-hydroxy-6-metoxy-1,4-benzoquinol methylase
MSTRFYDDYCKRKISIVKKFLSKEESILDVGCGNPEEIFCIKELKKYPRWVGLDLCPPENEKRVIKGDILKVKIKKFDTVICLDALEHFEKPNKVMKKMREIANEKIIIITPVTTSNLFRKILKVLKTIFGINIFQGHYHEFFESEIVEMANGLHCKKIIYTEFPIIWLSKLLFRFNLLKSGIFIFEKNK